MAHEVTSGQTNLPSEEVLARAVQFFTNEKWRVQTQSARNVTFLGSGGIPWKSIIIYIVMIVAGIFLCMTFFGMIIGIPLIIAGIVLAIRIRMKMLREASGGSENLVVTVSPLKEGTDITLTHSKAGNKLASQFINALPR